MNATFERRSYSIEFKLEAVRLADQSNQSKAQTAKELGIPHTLLYKIVNTIFIVGRWPIYTPYAGSMV